MTKWPPRVKEGGKKETYDFLWIVKNCMRLESNVGSFKIIFFVSNVLTQDYKPVFDVKQHKHILFPTYTRLITYSPIFIFVI